MNKWITYHFINSWNYSLPETGGRLYKMMMWRITKYFIINSVPISRNNGSHVNVLIWGSSCITNIQVRSLWLSESGCLIGCTLRLKASTQWETLRPKVERLWSDDFDSGWRRQLDKRRQDKRSQNQSRNCLFSKMRWAGTLTIKEVMVVLYYIYIKKNLKKAFKPTVML